MTCIVGVVERDSVLIGADSAGVGGLKLQLRGDEKVFVNGPFVMGFTSSFRMGQLLHYKLNTPPHPADMDAYEFMVKCFVEAVRNCLKEGGFATKDKEQESGGELLVGSCPTLCADRFRRHPRMKIFALARNTTAAYFSG
jgi:hypothetical protein